MLKSIPNFVFCDDLDSPELCVIMNHNWWLKNREEVLNTSGVTAQNDLLLLIPEPEDRMTFVLRFDPWQNS